MKDTLKYVCACAECYNHANHITPAGHEQRSLSTFRTPHQSNSSARCQLMLEEPTHRLIEVFQRNSVQGLR